MFTKTVTTTVGKGFGAVTAAVEDHRAEAAKTLNNPELIGATNGPVMDPDKPGHEIEGVLTVTSEWKEGPEPVA